MHLDASAMHAPATAKAAEGLRMPGAQPALHAELFIFGNAPSTLLAGVSDVMGLVSQNVIVAIIALLLVIGGGVGL